MFLKTLNISYHKSELYHFGAYTQRTLHKDIGSSKFILVLFIISRKCKESTCPFTEQWIRKMYSNKIKYLSGIEKNEIIKFDDNSVE